MINFLIFIIQITSFFSASIFVFLISYHYFNVFETLNNIFNSIKSYCFSIDQKVEVKASADVVKSEEIANHFIDYPTPTTFSNLAIFVALLGFINIIILIIYGLILAGLFTVLERKLLAVIQRRVGPNTAGFVGILQFLADGVKLVQKEVILQRNTQIALFITGPILLLGLALMQYGIIPLSKTPVLDSFEFGILLTLTLSSLTSLGLIAAAWASNSKYPFLSAMRSVSLLISYELIFGFILLIIGSITGQLNYQSIMSFQSHHQLALGMFLAPVILNVIVISLMETNRPPFDLAESESELGAGYNTEHSSLLFAFFFLAEYLNMAFMAFFLGALFVGQLGTFESTIIAIFLMFGFVIARGIVPRYRFDSIMEIGWKKLLPFMIGFFFFVVGCLIFFGAVIISVELPLFLQELSRLFFVYKPVYLYTIVKSPSELFDLNILFGFLDNEVNVAVFDLDQNIDHNTANSDGSVGDHFKKYLSNLRVWDFVLDWENGRFLENYIAFQRELGAAKSPFRQAGDIVNILMSLDNFDRQFKKAFDSYTEKLQFYRDMEMPKFTALKNFRNDCYTELSTLFFKCHDGAYDIAYKCSKPSLLVAMVNDYLEYCMVRNIDLQPVFSAKELAEKRFTQLVETFLKCPKFGINLDCVEAFLKCPKSGSGNVSCFTNNIFSELSAVLDIIRDCHIKIEEKKVLLRDLFLGFFSIQDMLKQPLDRTLALYVHLMSLWGDYIDKFQYLCFPSEFDADSIFKTMSPQHYVAGNLIYSLLDCPLTVGFKTYPAFYVFFVDPHQPESDFCEAIFWFSQANMESANPPAYGIDLPLYYNCAKAAIEAKSQGLSLEGAIDLLHTTMREYYLARESSFAKTDNLRALQFYQERLKFIENSKPYILIDQSLLTGADWAKFGFFRGRNTWFVIDQILRYMVLKAAGYDLAPSVQFIHLSVVEK